MLRLLFEEPEDSGLDFETSYEIGNIRRMYARELLDARFSVYELYELLDEKDETISKLKNEISILKAKLKENGIE